MSELPPQFDALEAARQAAAVSDEQLRFNELIGAPGSSDPLAPAESRQAAQDVVNYLEQRPGAPEAEDENRSLPGVQHKSSGQAMLEQAQDSFPDHSHYNATNEEQSYEGMTTAELIKRWAESEVNDDRTTASNIQDALQDRLIDRGVSAEMIDTLVSQKDKTKAAMLATRGESHDEPAEPVEETESGADDKAGDEEATPDTSRIDSLSDDDISNLDPSMMEDMSEAERAAYFARMHQLRGEDHLAAPHGDRDRETHLVDSFVGTAGEMGDNLRSQPGRPAETGGDDELDVPEFMREGAGQTGDVLVASGDNRTQPAAPRPRRTEGVEAGGASTPALPEVDRGEHIGEDDHLGGGLVADIWAGTTHEGPRFTDNEGNERTQAARSWHKAGDGRRKTRAVVENVASAILPEKWARRFRRNGAPAVGAVVENPEPAATPAPRRERVERPRAAERSGDQPAADQRSVDELLGDEETF